MKFPNLGTTLPPESEMIDLFGPIGDESDETTISFVGHPVQINKKLAPNLAEVSSEIEQAGLSSEVQNVGGFRTSVGASGSPIPYSMHQFGAAIDVNENTENWHTMTTDPRIVSIFANNHWWWGGNWGGASYDGGHFQFRGGTSVADNPSGNSGITTTSFNPVDPGTWLSSLADLFGAQSIADLAERAGLILLGGILIIVGVVILGNGKAVSRIILPQLTGKSG